MPYSSPPYARQLEHGRRFNRFLAILPPHDFSLLAPHLRTLALERGVMLHDVGEQIEHVYFPHTGDGVGRSGYAERGNRGNRHHWTSGGHRRVPDWGRGRAWHAPSST